MKEKNRDKAGGWRTSLRLRKKARRVALCMVSVLLATLLGGSKIAQDLERGTYDLRVALNAAQFKPSDEIVVIVIDDASLHHLDQGPWPWHRGVYAPLLDHCRDARVVAFDVMFFERDLNRNIGEAYDNLFVEFVRAHGRVVQAVLFDSKLETISDEPLLPGEWSLPLDAASRNSFRTNAVLYTPFPDLLAASAGAGHVNAFPHPVDGVLRDHPVWLNRNDQFIPSFALAALLVADGVSPAEVRNHPDGLQAGSRVLKIPENGVLPFVSLNGDHRKVTFYDLAQSFDEALEERIPPEVFKDKIVLVGYTATGTAMDWQVASGKAQREGVFVNATIIDNLMNGLCYLRPPAWVGPGLALLIGLIFSIPYAPAERPRRLFLFGTLVLAGFLVAVVLVGWFGLVMLPVSEPFMAWLLAMGFLSFDYWYQERAARRRLEEMERAKQQFTDMLVHDIKNHMTGVVLSANMLENDVGNLEPVALELASLIRASSERVVLEMMSLLDIRKMEEGKLPLEKAPKTLGEIVDPLMKEMKIPAAIAVCSLRLVGEELRDLEVELDSGIISRLLSNLVWNAIQHVKKETEIEIGLGRTEDSIQIWVSNAGPSIPEKQQAFIFSPFWSGELEKKKKLGGGTGLGLTFCRLAAEAHQGGIRVESPRPGETDGVRMILSLPI